MFQQDATLLFFDIFSPSNLYDTSVIHETTLNVSRSSFLKMNLEHLGSMENRDVGENVSKVNARCSCVDGRGVYVLTEQWVMLLHECSRALLHTRYKVSVV